MDSSTLPFGGRFVGSSSNYNLVLDTVERGKLVNVVKPETKASMATKNHCEAERRRRERINSHLSTLRDLVPTTSKMDKAALLAQVVTTVKELKNNASQTSQKILLPSDVDQVAVKDYVDHRGIFIKASICCQDRPELLSDLKKIIRSLHLHITSSNISFLRGRVKNEFVVACEENTSDSNNIDKKTQLRNSLRKALEDLLARISYQVEFSPRTLLAGGKRRRSSSLYSLS